MFRIFIVFCVLFSIHSVSSAEQDIAAKIVKEVCQHCHGMDGEASNIMYPRLAGQHNNYIVKQLTNFRSGERKGTMNDMAKDLTDNEIVALAAYFSAKPTRKHRVRDKEFAQVGWYIFHRGNQYSGIPACASCHGENGEGSDALPRLAGQHKRYVTDQLHQFINKQRLNPIMHSVAKKLTELEMNAVASYVSGLK